MRISVWIALLALVATTSCAINDRESGDGVVEVYSTRSEKIMSPLVEEFEKQTGIKVHMRYGATPDLKDIDVFVADDSGQLVRVRDELAELPDPIWRKVPSQYRDPAKRWAGISAREDGSLTAVGILTHADGDKDARHFTGNLFSKEGQARFDEVGEKPLVADAAEVVEADKADPNHQS
ncbi:MAG: hypothetical protein HOQ05_07975 [Corynebacteriales bacterium]|nr:hypothetical protein [Mycobacteriales bacterium]